MKTTKGGYACFDTNKKHMTGYTTSGQKSGCCKMTCKSLDDATKDCPSGKTRKSTSDGTQVAKADEFEATCCQACQASNCEKCDSDTNKCRRCTGGCKLTNGGFDAQGAWGNTCEAK